MTYELTYKTLAEITDKELLKDFYAIIKNKDETRIPITFKAILNTMRQRGLDKRCPEYFI